MRAALLLPLMTEPSENSLSSPGAKADFDQIRLTFFIIGIAVLIRLWFLSRSGLELYGDEAQYFAWSQNLALGYFTKPPLIAWVIAGTTGLFGTSEAAVRLAAPLFHALTAAFLLAAGTRLFDLRAGAAAALVWILLPGVSFSSVIISTDAPLLMFAAMALMAYIGLWRGPVKRQDAIILGIALGLGLMSKLAMAYMLLCMAAHMILDRRARDLLRSPNFWLALGLGALIYAPNIIWNLSHGGATYGHLAENAALDRAGLHLDAALSFLGGQLGIFGPIPLFVLALATAQAWRHRSPELILCLCFTYPVLGLMVVEAAASRAFANWAAFAYPAATLAVGHVLAGRPKWALGNAIFHGALGLALYAWGLGLFYPGLKSDPVANLHGWRTLSREIAKEWRVAGVPELIATDRMDMARLLYYLPDKFGDVRIISSDGRAHSEFDLNAALNELSGGSGLLVSRFRDLGPLEQRFESVELQSAISVPRPHAATLKYYLFRVRMFHGPDAAKQADNPSR